MTMVMASLLSANFLKLEEEIRALEQANIDGFHIDVMDGVFVPNLTIGPVIIKALRKLTKKFLDVHLMINAPEHSLKDYIACAVDAITVHAESSKHLHRLISVIKDHGIKAGVALNPASHESVLQYIISDLDLILIMSVNPGFSGQHFLPQSLKKIAKIKSMLNDCGNHECYISIDGGINNETAKQAIKEGVSCLVSGSYIFLNHDYKSRIELLRNG